MAFYCNSGCVVGKPSLTENGATARWTVTEEEPFVEAKLNRNVSKFNAHVLGAEGPFLAHFPADISSLSSNGPARLRATERQLVQRS